MSKLYTQYLVMTGALLTLAACRNDATTFAATNTDKFVFYSEDYYTQARNVLQADYLIVQDMSYSMNVTQETVRDALSQFAQDLESGSSAYGVDEIDYRIGLVRGTNQPTAAPGVSWESTLPSNFLGAVLTPSSISSLLDGVASAIPGNSPNKVVILEAAKRTIQAQKSNFLRDSAQLVYVFISGSDDESKALLGANRTETYYKNALKGVKRDPSYITARAFVYDTETNCRGQGTHGWNSGNTLASVAGLLNSDGAHRHCLNSSNAMADSLKDLARNVTKPTKRFALRATPVPSSIAIRVAGRVTAQNDTDFPWSYNAATNEIVFTQSAIPATESLEIQYDMVMKLSRQPRLDTMVVTVNGQIVPSSAVHYDAATREIQIGGNYAPRHNQTVLVNYEVR